MRVHLICIVYLMISNGVAQTHNGKVVPKITTLPIEDGEVTVLRLSPGYATSVRLPEEITSVMIGNPASFKAEHSEYEPRLVFLKPTTNQPAESNALITTKSGHQVSLHLVSAGNEAVNQRVDFVVEYRRPRSLLVGQDNPSVLIGETQPNGNGDSGQPRQLLDVAEQELEKQKGISSPAWTGKEMQVAIGDSTEKDHQMILGFSVLNSSNRAIELLPPQLQLSGSANGTERIKSEPVPIVEYHVTARRLEPGQRADGVVVFDRPSFKESREHLEFELAQAGKVDQPVVVPIPFTAIKGEVK
jgi:hypothetical protein